MIFLIETSDGGGLGKSLLLSLLSACSSLFHSEKREMKVGYFFLILSAIVMFTLSLVTKMPDVPHMDVIRIIVAVYFPVLLSLSISFYISAAVYDNDGDRPRRHFFQANVDIPQPPQRLFLQGNVGIPQLPQRHTFRTFDCNSLDILY